MAVERRAAAVALAGFVVLGLPAGAVGIAWPAMRSELSAPLYGLGLLLAAFTVAYFVTAMFTGRLVERLGGGRVVTAGAILSGAALAIFFLAPTWWAALTAAILWGAASGPFDAGLNTFAATRGVRLMGWLHAAWGLGAALGPPLVLGMTAWAGSWRFAYLVMAATFVAIAILCRYIGIAWTSRIEPSDPSASGAGRPMLLSALTAFFFVYVGLETCAGQWAFSQLTLSRGLNPAAAATGVSLYWAALAAGRAGLGTAGHRLPARTLLDASITLALGACLLFWLAPAAIASLIALPLLGLGLSTVFPLGLTLTPERFDPGRVARIIGYQMAAGVGGGGLVPVVLGVTIQSLGWIVLGPSLLAMALGQSGLHLAIRLMESGRKATASFAAGRRSG
jgi:fucose permease